MVPRVLLILLSAATVCGLAAADDHSGTKGVIDDFDSALISRDFSAITKLIASSATVRLSRCDAERQLSRDQFVALLSERLLSAHSYMRIRREQQIDALGGGLGGVSHSVVFESLQSGGVTEESRWDEIIYVTVIEGSLRISTLHWAERCR